MIEAVGNCRVCGRTVYCREGFLEGIVQPNEGVLCFECFEKREEEEPPSSGNGTV